ncbi:MAG: hypothetical protein QW059_07410 [Nitrososphaerota archaeon]
MKTLEKLSEIVFDRQSGSSQIAARLLNHLEAATLEIEAGQVGNFLEEAYAAVLRRRSLISPINLVDALRRAYSLLLEEKGAQPDLRMMIRRLRGMYLTSLEVALKIAGGRLAGCERILTLSKSSQVVSALKRVVGVEARVLAGWPLMDGLAAYRDLRASGVRAILFPDLSVFEAVREVDALLIGCDAVLPDGSAVNRSGSRAAALAAQEMGVPTLVICDSSKLDINNLWAPEEWGLELEGAAIRFQVFEKVDRGLVTEYVSEHGCLSPSSFVDVAGGEILSWPRRLLQQE